MAENHRTWSLGCLDFGGRERTLDVIAVPKFVIVRTPPGEVAYLKFAAIEPFREVALDAMVAATRLS